ncbi:hypothetical protein JVT61DRAFT_6091 [Boletus reticuloceps]|uniref:Uncharacterized protein n=1 Tax=Boletus reticuloceps TaxID=495285 RepID=A0A8I2YMI8_9AGAM|nr:hypothetical protein JVT61DRAFT_6091 [Boletus reticuloceps]
MASLSWSRTPSMVSSISSHLSRISLAEDNGISLAGVPPLQKYQWNFCSYPVFMAQAYC